jgi:hypothetical protein
LVQRSSLAIIACTHSGEPGDESTLQIRSDVAHIVRGDKCECVM